eukprot:893927-Alexandrium_andersonii.AAC.1
MTTVNFCSSGDSGTWWKAFATSVPKKLTESGPCARRRSTASETTSEILGGAMRSPCLTSPLTRDLRRPRAIRCLT